MKKFTPASTKTMQDYLPSMNEIKAKWRLQVGAALETWDQLSESDLLQSEGHKILLVDMLQDKYYYTRDEANKQVNRFFEKHMSWRM